MEKSKQNLRIMSILILALAAITVIRLIAQLVLGNMLSAAMLPAGADESILKIAAGILIAAGLLLLLPQIYVGLKGLKMAKNPDSSKAHIVWAIILLVLAVLPMFSTVKALVAGADIMGSIVELCLYAVDVILYICFIKYAKEVRAEA